MTMSEIDDVSELDRVGGLPVRSEEIGFAPDELIKCGKCARSNAPTRSSCMYCGAEVESGSAAPKLNLRAVEGWANGFNVVITEPAINNLDSPAKEIAAILSMDADVVRAILSCESGLPLARVEDVT